MSFHPAQALALFRHGNDTMEIAAALGCTEAEAHNALHDARKRERARLLARESARRLSAYRRAPKQMPSRIPYAGYEQ